MDLYLNGSFSFKGTVSESELYQIRNAISLSELMEQEIQSEILTNFPIV